MENNKQAIIINGTDYAPMVRSQIFKLGVFLAGAFIVSKMFGNT
jgi:hypothetical protein